jgi:hypothetical protein
MEMTFNEVYREVIYRALKPFIGQELNEDSRRRMTEEVMRASELFQKWWSERTEPEKPPNAD